MADVTRVELEGLMHGWASAIVSNDVAGIRAYMADDWVLVTPEGGPIEGSRFLGAVEEGQLRHDAMAFEDGMRVRVYGNTAVVTGHVTNRGHYAGQPFSANEWSTSVFIRVGGAWKCVLTALTPVASGA